MDPRTLTRDAPKIHAVLKELEDKRLVTTKGCKIYIPSRYAERGLAQVGVETNIVGMAAIVFSTFVELLSGVRSQEIECIDSLCLRLVCAARYPHTAAFAILDGVNAAMVANPKLDIREAAAISAARYAAKWVAEQFKVGV